MYGLQINSTDLMATYGARLIEGLSDLVAYPPMKKYRGNNWFEHSGEDVWLGSLFLDSRDVSLTFAVNGSEQQAREFQRWFLTQEQLFLNFTGINRAYKVVLQETQSVRNGNGLHIIKMKFTEDEYYPFVVYTHQQPQSTIPAYTDYSINGTPFTNYGIRILKGTLGDFIKQGKYRDDIVRKLPNMAGQERLAQQGIIPLPNNMYQHTQDSRDVTLRCLMRAESLNELWRNYDSLLWTLRTQQLHWVNVLELNKNFAFIYKSCNVKRFYPTDKIWLEFDLKITLIGGLDN